MVTLRYIGPLDEVDIPLARASNVQQGGEFECPKAAADVLLDQSDNYELVPAKKKG